MKETNGTLTATTVAIAADPQRIGLILANTSDTVMTYRPSGTASATAGIVVAAGSNIIMKGEEGRALIINAGTLFCAGSAKSYTIYEW
jgi:hypothetical protein